MNYIYRILIKRHRRRRRMSQKRLSERSGVSTSHISHLEANNDKRDRTPTLQVLESICQSLNVCPYHIGFYPCVECPQNIKCILKEKDMRDPEIIAKEILGYYI